MSRLFLFKKTPQLPPLLFYGFLASFCFHILAGGTFLLWSKRINARRVPHKELLAAVELEKAKSLPIPEAEPAPPPFFPPQQQSAPAQNRPLPQQQQSAPAQNRPLPGNQGGKPAGPEPPPIQTSNKGNIPIPSGTGHQQGTGHGGNGGQGNGNGGGGGGNGGGGSGGGGRGNSGGLPIGLKCGGCHIEEPGFVAHGTLKPQDAKDEEEYAFEQFIPFIAKKVKKNIKSYVMVWVHVSYDETGAPLDASVAISSGDSDIDWVATKIAMNFPMTPVFHGTPFGDQPTKFHLTYGIGFAPSYSNFPPEQEWEKIRMPGENQK